MSNEIMRIAAPPMPLNEVIELSNVFFRSGLFKDATDATHFIVKIQAGQELGIPPFQAVTGIHVIAGKPVMGAGILASRVKASGKYDYDLLKLDDKVCKIEFFQRDGTKRKSLGESAYTLEDAQKAGVKNLEKMPRNMLFARAVSNGVRWFCADIFSGPVYTPEEFESEITEDASAVVTTQNPGGLTEVERAATAPKTLSALTSDHPDWANCVNFLKTGGTVDKLRVRFFVSPEAETLLKAAANTKPITQEEIHANNAGYAGPVEDELDTEKPF